MKVFVMSDIHADFYVREWQPNFNVLVDDYTPHFDKMYDLYFQSADAIIIAGDIANDETTQVEFLKYISTKYNDVYVCFGNHDYTVIGATLFKCGHLVTSSEEREKYVIYKLREYTNVKFLNSSTLLDDFITGTYGACDLTMGGLLDNYTDRAINYCKWYDCRVQKWENYNKRHCPNVTKLWNWQSEIMHNCCKAHPKVIVTHFCPSQLGVHKLYDNCMSNAYFFFNGTEFLEELPDGAIWICGHIHTCAKTEYTNSKGNKITIMASPLGYPGEQSLVDGYVTDYSAHPRGEGKLISFDSSFRLIEI